MGETAAKLRLIFDAISETRAVYLFDEFDALGTDRASRNEVGEIRRVLNSFLQFIEHDDSDSVIVAATNHPALLDRALLRRFDSVVKYALPTPAVALQILKNRLALLNTAAVKWSIVARSARKLSQAELARACENAVKHAVMARRTSLTTAVVVQALQERRASQSPSPSRRPVAVGAEQLGGHGLKRHVKRVGLRNREVKLFEPNDAPGDVLHQDDLFAGFFTDVLSSTFRKPDGQGLALSVVEHLHFGHICVPSLMASVGYTVIKNA